MPKISVLMGVYNCEKTVAAAIESIQKQTFSDWEFIICDDGSVDNSISIVKEYAKNDKRIIALENDQNHGLPYTLNRCLEKASGEYCARMDADDLCDPTRFEKQVQFLDSHPEFGFVCTRMKRFDEQGFYELNRAPGKTQPTKKDLIKGSPFSHASAMIRKIAYDAVGGYRDLKRVQGDEDYDLWFRLYAKNFFGYNIEERLYFFFDGRGASKRRTMKRRLNESRVRRDGYKALKAPFWCYIYALKPIMLGLIPKFIYDRLRKKGR